MASSSTESLSDEYIFIEPLIEDSIGSGNRIEIPIRYQHQYLNFMERNPFLVFRLVKPGASIRDAPYVSVAGWRRYSSSIGTSFQIIDALNFRQDEPHIVRLELQIPESAKAITIQAKKESFNVNAPDDPHGDERSINLRLVLQTLQVLYVGQKIYIPYRGHQEEIEVKEILSTYDSKISAGTIVDIDLEVEFLPSVEALSKSPEPTKLTPIIAGAPRTQPKPKEPSPPSPLKPFTGKGFRFWSSEVPDELVSSSTPIQTPGRAISPDRYAAARAPPPPQPVVNRQIEAFSGEGRIARSSATPRGARWARYIQ